MAKQYDINTIFQELCGEHSAGFLAKKLNVNVGTVNRWKSQGRVPKNYIFDLLKIAGIDIDYSMFTYKDKDQFFTPEKIAKYYINKTCDVLNQFVNVDEYSFIEPSAGNGAFFNSLPSPKIGMDIETDNPEIETKDFLDYTPPEGKYITIGNPPFGLRGQKALQFILHAFEFSDFVAFILPPLFDSDGRGTPKKRVGQHLIFSEKVFSNEFYYPNDTVTRINCIFQIWSKEDFGVDLNEFFEPHGYKVYSLSDGGTPATTRNKDKLYKCDYYLPSTVFGKNNMKLYPSFEDLPQRRGYGIILEDKTVGEKIEKIDWGEVGFRSTNNAVNLRTSIIVKAIETGQD